MLGLPVSRLCIKTIDEYIDEVADEMAEEYFMEHREET
jgi:hypothetical protein